MIRDRTTIAALLAIGAAFFGVSPGARADTVFDITSAANSYSGTVTINTAAGTVTNANIMIAALSPNFTIILGALQIGNTFDLTTANGTSSGPAPLFRVSFDDGGTLAGYAGGAISASNLNGLCDQVSGFCLGMGGSQGTGTLTPVVTATPIPPALALFATGLGALGLLGWRRKRKASA
jgi:hypothetical protein